MSESLNLKIEKEKAIIGLAQIFITLAGFMFAIGGVLLSLSGDYLSYTLSLSTFQIDFQQK